MQRTTFRSIIADSYTDDNRRNEARRRCPWAFYQIDRVWAEAPETGQSFKSAVTLKRVDLIRIGRESWERSEKYFCHARRRQDPERQRTWPGRFDPSIERRTPPAHGR